MKWIKYFEDLNNWYRECSRSELSDIILGKDIVPFSKHQEIINLLGDSIGKNKLKEFKRVGDGRRATKGIYSGVNLAGKEFEIGIWEIDDDWFPIMIQSQHLDWPEYYVCDQWDGLVRLLMDKEIIQ